MNARGQTKTHFELLSPSQSHMFPNKLVNNLTVLKRMGQFVLPKRFHAFGAAVYWYGRKYRCPICGWHTRAFRATRSNPEYHEMCHRCGSMARHRLIWLYLKSRKADFFTAKHKVLHFSPERCFERRFQAMRNLDYTSADVAGGWTPGMETIDLLAINKPDNLYDVVICIHVLGHVRDDVQATREILRVLKPGGWAILNSHLDLSREITFEDPAITSPEDRLKYYKQDDLYRVYGRDFQQRLEKVGFDVQPDRFVDEISKHTIDKCFLHTPGTIYLCKKPL